MVKENQTKLVFLCLFIKFMSYIMAQPSPTTTPTGRVSVFSVVNGLRIYIIIVIANRKYGKLDTSCELR